MAAIPHPAGLVEPVPAVAHARAPAPWTHRAAEFAEEVVGPLGLVLARRAGPRARPTPAPVAEFVALATQEGFTRLTRPADRGGAGLDRGAEYEVLETLAAADAGLAAVLAVTALSARIAGELVSTGERADASGCACGCVVGTIDGPVALRRDGAGWRLRGATRRPVTAAAIATHAAVACIDATASRRYTVVIVPLDRAGIRRCAPPPEPGLRGRLPAWLSFDEVRLERDEVLPAHCGGERIALSLAAAELLGVATGCAGLARAA
jgi:alkylation response protein AidB-like acyl-CoA dehydrogenase